MNNIPNTYRFQAIIGFILLLLSLSYMPLRMEMLLLKRTDLIREKETDEAEAELQSMEHGLSKEQMNELNIEVNRTNDEINQLINHSASVNDSINTLMTRAANEPNLLDTIQDLYNRGIMADERKIDSLNQLFTKTSNQLMERIRSFNQKDRDLKMVQAKTRNDRAKIRYFSIFLPIHLGILVAMFLSGLAFFVNGLKKWQWQHKQRQDSDHK